MTPVRTLFASVCLWILLCAAGSALGALEGYPTSPRSPLDQAACDGDLEQIKSLLAQEKNPYARDYALRFAVRGKHREIADLLIANGARNALYIAAAEGDVSFLKDLLAGRSSENERDSALHAAAWCGHKDVAELLLSAGADVNVRRFGDYTPLFVAASAGCDLNTLGLFTNSPFSPWSADMTERKRSPANPEVFRDVVDLLIRHGADVNAREKQHGFTPLHYAVFGGSKEVVAMFLDQGAPANPLIPPDAAAGGYVSPLHLAAHYGDLAICELLIARGADVNLRLPTENRLWIHPTQRMPLHHAAESGNGELVRFLVEHGAQINVADSEGQTPLLVASRHADTTVVETLLSHGADVNAADEEGRTALHHAADRQNVSMVETLLSRGADANRKSNDGQTPASVATANGSEEIVRRLTNRGGRVTIHTAASTGDLVALERLVREGVDVNRLDVQGQTALHAAANAGQLAAARWLVEHGANVNLADSKNATALSIATDQARAAHRMKTAETLHKAVMAYLISQGASLPFTYGLPGESARAHSEEVADAVLASLPNPDIVPDANNTLLHWAAHWGNKQAVLNLIELGADLNASNSRGATPLYYAIPRFGKPWDEDPYLRGHRDIVRLLIDRGAVVDPNSTILLRAADCSDVEIMELLLAKGADPNAATEEGITLLSVLLRSHWLTAEETKVRMKDYIMGLIRRGMRIDGRTADGVTTLQQAAALEFPDLLQELLSRGAPVNAKSNKGWTALHSAVAIGHAELVESLLKHGAEVNVVGYPPFDGWIPAMFKHHVERVSATPLQIATSQGDDQIVKLLIDAENGKADPSLAGENGKTPLVLAFEKKDTETLKLLLDNGVDANVRRANGVPLIYLAASQGRRDAVELLLGHGARGDATTIAALLETGTTPLHEAAGRGDADEVRKLLNGGAEADVPNREGFLPIHRANARYHVEAAKLLAPKTPKPVLTSLLFHEMYDKSCQLIPSLIAHGADINSHESFRRLTPLHHAVEKDNIRAIELLIAEGADINAQDESGETPLGVAVFRKQKEAVALFLLHGAQTNTLYKGNDLEGCTPLHLALRYGASDIAEMLVSAGSNVNLKGGFGREAPLHMAMGNKTLFELMLQHGGEIDNPTGNGMTCLHVAAAGGQDDWVRSLIDKGAHVNIQDRNGDTPLHLAAKAGKGSTCRILLAHGADIQIANRQGLLPLQYAQASDLGDIVVDLTPKSR